MANIKARKSKDGKITSYQIRVFQRWDAYGKQIMYTCKYKIDPLLTDKQNRAKAEAMAIEFEAQCKQGFKPEKNLTFKQYSERFIDQKQNEGTKHSTLAGYRRALLRINAGIGDIPLTKLNSDHITQLYNQLRQEGIRGNSEKAVCKVALKQILKQKKITKEGLSKKADVSLAVISSCYHQKNIMPEKAEAIANVLEADVNELFDFIKDDTQLSAKTIREHQRIVYEILEKAYDEDKILKNPAKKVNLEKISKSEPQYFQPDEIKAIIAAADKEHLDKKVMIMLMAATGMRRGELVGLTWSAIDMDNCCLDIKQTIMYRTDVGMYISTPKTDKSKRKVLLPEHLIRLLKEYRKEWQKARETYGTLWNYKVKLPDEDSIKQATNGEVPKVKSYPSDFLFYKTENGKIGYPINPDSLTGWCNKFSQRHGLPHINPHAFRHTIISILSYNNIDTAAIAQMVGHSNTYTTQETYTHTFSKGSRRAVQTIEQELFGGDVEKNDE